MCSPLEHAPVFAYERSSCRDSETAERREISEWVKRIQAPLLPVNKAYESIMALGLYDRTQELAISALFP